MELSELQSLVSEWDKLRNKIVTEAGKTKTVKTYLDQYNPASHSITNTTDRPDKIITVEENGASVTKTVKVARLVLPIQKKIVSMAAAFLCGNPIQIDATPSDQTQSNILEVVRSTWTSNKLDYESKRLAKILFSETEVAELWYTEPVDNTYWAGSPNEGSKFRLRMKVIANSFGDILYPLFNNAGDLIAFGREYALKVDGKEITHFDLYTDKVIYLSEKIASGWDTKEEPNLIGKIPVIYYSQPAPEWADVQTLIDRFEKTLSNHSDTNDYFASPMVKVKGKIAGFAAKGESGKVLELEDGAEAEYMSWDQSPKSLELEFKNLRSLIFDMTDTPDISIEQMKALGTYSGIALKMLFLAAHLKAADKEENFGVCIQRRLNFIKEAMAKINLSLSKATALDIRPRFEYFLPKDEAALIDMLVTATGSKPIMSQSSAVSRNPIVDDPEKEMEALKEETTVENITP
jgi:SPP1 family phage portal protein